MDQAEGLRNHFRSLQQAPDASTSAVVKEEKPARPAGHTKSRLVAVCSGKGGVGKTNLSVNLALALSECGQRTYLLDADLGLGNVEILLGLSPRHDLSHVVLGNQSLPEIVVAGPGGLQIIPGGSGWHQLTHLSSWRLNRLIEDLRALDEDADFILIDTGAGIGTNVTQFALAAHEVVVVTTPEPTALTDAYSLIKVMSGENPQSHVRLVVNLASGKGEAEAVFQRLNSVMQRFLQREAELLGWIPRDRAVTAAVERQEPLLLAFPGSAAARSVRRIAQRVLGVPPPGFGQGMADMVSRLISFWRRG